MKGERKGGGGEGERDESGQKEGGEGERDERGEKEGGERGRER